MMPLAISQRSASNENMVEGEDVRDDKVYNFIGPIKKIRFTSLLIMIVILTTIGLLGLMMVLLWWNTIEEHNLKEELRDVKFQVTEMRLQLKKNDQRLQHLNWTLSQQSNMTEHVFNYTAHDLQTVHEEVSTQTNIMAYQFAGTFAVIASMISIWHMSSHLRNYNEPFVQKKIIAILWMVPVYSITSWLTLVTASEYFNVIKDFYESFIIYTFLSFLIAVLGRGNRKVVIDTLARNHTHLKPPVTFALPSCGKTANYCLSLSQQQHRREYYQSNPYAKAEAVLYQCQVFTMQFVFLRPLTSIAMTLCNVTLGNQSKWNTFYPQFYIFIIQNISVATAFTGLLRFYHAVQAELKWCRAFAKFLCIKGIVFMTFWQGVLISIFAKTVVQVNDHVLQSKDTTPTEWSLQAQSFLICLEMLFFAIIHGFVFTTEEWKHGYQPGTAPKLFEESLIFEDFKKDLQFLLKSRDQSNMTLNGKPEADFSDNPTITLQSSFNYNEQQEDSTDYNDTKNQSTKRRRPGKYYIVYKPNKDEADPEGEELSLTEQDNIIKIDRPLTLLQEKHSSLDEGI
jgi:hypothetical protein